MSSNLEGAIEILQWSDFGLLVSRFLRGLTECSTLQTKSAEENPK